MRIYYSIIFLLVTLIGAKSINAQPSNYEFRQLPKGISHNHVYSIFQDSKGFIWFGTRNGLNRFDGINYKVFQKDISDSLSLSSSEIRHISELKSGDLLISTYGGGINYFNRSTGAFREIDLGVPLSRKDINQTIEDELGNFWVATESDGLLKLDSSFQVVKHWNTDTGLPTNGIRNIVHLKNGIAWVSVFEAGLGIISDNDFTLYNTNNSSLPSEAITVSAPTEQVNEFWLGFEDNGIALVRLSNTNITVLEHYSSDESSKVKLATNKVLSVFEDPTNKTWIGLENGGLYVVDRSAGTSLHYVSNSKEALSISDNSIWSIFQDKNNSVWLGTFNQGVNVVHGYYNKFQHFKNDPLKESSLNNDNVTSFLERENGIVWVGTDGGGINLFNRENNTFEAYTTQTARPWRVSSNAILSICDDDEGNVWAGTWAGGVNLITDAGITNYTQENSTLGSNNIFSISKSHDQSLWVAVWGAGIYSLNPSTKEFTPTDIPIANNLIFEILEDRDKNLWVGTTSGLFFIPFEGSLQKNNIVEYRHTDVEGSLSSNLIHDIFEDSQGQIWIGTSDGGLNKYNAESNSFEVITRSNGLPSDAIQGITEDLLGNLWVSTSNGITKYNHKENTFENFDAEDGLQEGVFIRKSVYKSPENELFFGGANGFNFFHPNYLPTNSFVPPVQLTGFSIFNKPVKIGKDSPLTERIETAKSVMLSHEDLIFTVDFVALNFIHSENNHFQYQLKNFNDAWIDLGNQHSVTFTGIPPGNYTLNIKGANNDKVWNDTPTSLEIIIIPPWWDTWWAKVIFGVIVVVIIVVVFYLRTQNLKNQTERLEKKVKLRTAELQEKQSEILTQNEELLQSQEELETQRDYIKLRSEELENTNKHINHSILAAQHIQMATLPSHEKLAEFLGDYFLIFKPRDIVSGDFYWISNRTDSKWIVTADCTGHGVPGAFMSLLGVNILDNLINTEKTDTPAEVLESLNQEIKTALNYAENEVSMGMDLAILKLPNERSESGLSFQFAGAKNDLMVYDYSKKKLEIHRGDRILIGATTNKKKEFQNHDITLPKESVIYLGSDGYQDQNNTKRARIGSKRLRDTLEKSGHIPLREQKKNLLSILETHMEDTEQRDDILLMGIRV